MSAWAKAAMVVLLVLAASAVGACKRSAPELTCKVNDVCFACPNAKAQASCRSDPTSSRCKWTEPANCK